MNSVSYILWSLCFLGFSTISVSGRRSFDIVIQSINCSSHSKFVGEMSCHVDSGGVGSKNKQPKATLIMQMCKSVKNPRFSFELDAIKSKTEHFTLFSSKDIDGCEYLEGTGDQTLTKILKEIMADSAKELPKCPIPEHFRFELKDMFVDSEKFPPYVPETKFALTMTGEEDKEMFFWLKVSGEVVQKKKNKGVPFK